MVAPMSVMVPASTGFRKMSCCALVKRWISSQKMMVRRPVSCSSLKASLKYFLHSATPELVAFSSMKRLPVLCAMQRAMVVFPVPEPPQRIMEGTRSVSISERNTPLGPTRSWPKTSSREPGRMRSARGADLLFVFVRFTSGWIGGLGCCTSPPGPPPPAFPFCCGVSAFPFPLIPFLFLAASTDGESNPGPSSNLRLLPVLGVCAVEVGIVPP